MYVQYNTTIQADSKSKATVKNYEKRNKRFLTWLRSNEPSCWDDGSADGSAVCGLPPSTVDNTASMTIDEVAEVPIE